MALIKAKRGTRSELNTAAGASELSAGEIYLITDEGRFAIGLSATTYSAFAIVATTLAGYGITDAAPASRTISTTAPLTGGGDLSANRTFAIPAATASVDGYATATQITKLNGIATGATANDTDANLRARSSHTGTQAWSTLTSTPTTLSGYGITDAAPASAAAGMTPNSQSAAYTLVLSDAGKYIFHPAADTTARVWTIPANASVAYPVGTALTFINENGAGVITIAITSDTMRLAGAGTTGSRTLAANGMATAVKVTSTSWIISGVGLT